MVRLPPEGRGPGPEQRRAHRRGLTDTPKHSGLCVTRHPSNRHDSFVHLLGCRITESPVRTFTSFYSVRLPREQTQAGRLGGPGPPGTAASPPHSHAPGTRTARPFAATPVVPSV